MDDQRFGASLRAARLRRGLRQRDLAAVAGVSDAAVSRAERGRLEAMSLGTMRRISSALGIRLELLPRTAGAELDRLLNARHAALAEEVLRRLPGIGGWVARPEVSFAIYGERGVVDVLAWHAATATLLVIEVKTAIVDVGELLGTLDRKRRLARAIAEPLGWRPVSVATWLVVAESMTNRRRVQAHRGSFEAVLPDDGRRLWRWLGRPVGVVHALSFVTDRRQDRPRSGYATLLRAPGPAHRPSAARTERGTSRGPVRDRLASTPNPAKHPRGVDL